MIAYLRAAVRLLGMIAAAVFGVSSMAGAIIKVSQAAAREIGLPVYLHAFYWVCLVAMPLFGRQGLFNERVRRFAVWSSVGVAACLSAALALLEAPAFGVVSLISYTIFYKGVTYFIDNFSVRVKPAAQRSGKNQLVLIEGNIGAGKSTLCKALHEHLGDRVSVELEVLSKSLHTAFVTDPKTFGYALQMVMADRRKRDYDNWVSCDSLGRKFVDRLLLGDMAFAVANYVLGHIDSAQFETYLEMMGSSPAQAFGSAIRQKKVTLLYVHTPIEVCAKRIADRKTVDCDTALDYLHMVSIAHILCLLHVARQGLHEHIVLFGGENEGPNSKKSAVSFVKAIGGKKDASLYTAVAAKQCEPAKPLRLSNEAGERLEALADKWSGGKGWPRMRRERNGSADDDTVFELSEDRWYAFLKKELEKEDKARSELKKDK